MNTSCEQKLEHCCDDNNPIGDNSTNVDAVDSLCANCGKGEENSGDLKACNACKMVKYCNRDCQIAHRPQHKNACKKRAAELHDEALFKDVEPEECPICLISMPYETKTSHFKSCCGKRICIGCIYGMMVSEGKDLCAFCRMPDAKSDDERIKQIKKLMDKGNAEAFNNLAGWYAEGSYGLPQDLQKANELYLKAGKLGCAVSYYNLGISYLYGDRVQADRKKAKHYFELAAIGGHVLARHNSGCLEGDTGNERRAMKHFMISAKGGCEQSLDFVKQGFMENKVSKVEYANTLRAYHERQREMKSDQREKAKASGMIHDFQRQV